MFFNLRTSENNLDKGFFQDLNLYVFVKIDSLDNLINQDFNLKKMEIEEIKTIKAEQNDFFKSGKTKDLSYRIQALKTLRKAIKENSKTIADALKEDLNKSETESYLTETGMALASISYSLKHIKSWAKPKRVNTPFAQFPSSSHIVPEPYGVCLIIAPWNYPFLLAIDPLIAAISAGNCAIVKPSEL